MPQINVAMTASLRRGWLNQRDVVTDIGNVGHSFSSWDNCMAAPYCKWPVIVAIIIAGLIVLSVVSCIIRCACCGMSCCCSCFSCLKCCGDCCGCCDNPKGRRHKHLDDPYHPPQQGYAAPPPMMAGAIGGASGYEPPKYAQFETGPTGHALDPKVVNDDALPPMPSWDTAAKKHVLAEDAEGAVEMGELDPKTGQEVPLMSGAGPISRTGSPAISPVQSPYNDRPGMNAQNGYMGPGPMGAGPNGLEPGAMGVGALGAGALGAGAVAGGAMAVGGRGNGMDPYGRNGPPMGRGYGPPGQPVSPMDGPGRGQSFNNQFSQGQSYPPNPNGPGSYGPGPVAGGAYGRAQPQRQYTGDSSRGFPPQQRQYTGEPNRPLIAPTPQRSYPDSAPIPFPEEPSYSQPSRRMASPPNNSGFDFGDTNSGRGPGPQPINYGPSGGMNRRPVGPSQIGGGYAGSTAPPSYASRSPPPDQRGGGGYSGYSDYARPQPGRAPPSSEGRRREAQGWDAV